MVFVFMYVISGAKKGAWDSLCCEFICGKLKMYLRFQNHGRMGTREETGDVAQSQAAGSHPYPDEKAAIPTLLNLQASWSLVCSCMPVIPALKRWYRIVSSRPSSVI